MNPPVHWGCWLELCPHGTQRLWKQGPKDFFAIVQKKKPKNNVFLFLRDGISKAAEYAKKKGFTLREFFLNKKLTQ